MSRAERSAIEWAIQIYGTRPTPAYSLAIQRLRELAAEASTAGRITKAAALAASAYALEDEALSL